MGSHLCSRATTRGDPFRSTKVYLCSSPGLLARGSPISESMSGEVRDIFHRESHLNLRMSRVEHAKFSRVCDRLGLEPVEAVAEGSASQTLAHKVKWRNCAHKEEWPSTALSRRLKGAQHEVGGIGNLGAREVARLGSISGRAFLIHVSRGLGSIEVEQRYPAFFA